MPVNGKPNGRFELPAFTPLNFSLTDGTNIPPPPDSPIQETPPAPALATPAPKPVSRKEVPQVSTPISASHTATVTVGSDNYDGRGRTTDHPPMSPTSSKRPSSIRRFLSRKSLNTNYEDGTNHSMSREDLMMMDRPESAMSFASGMPSLKKQKSGSWFRRLGSSGGGQHKTSVIYEEKTVVPMGPPPPKLPELNQLKARIPENDDGGFGGEDLFKNIK